MTQFIAGTQKKNYTTTVRSVFPQHHSKVALFLLYGVAQPSWDKHLRGDQFFRCTAAKHSTAGFSHTKEPFDRAASAFAFTRNPRLLVSSAQNESPVFFVQCGMRSLQISTFTLLMSLF